MDIGSSGKGRMVITIDGPAGTGKTSVAQRLANRLSLDSLDTGAMYRAVALRSIFKHLDPSDVEGIALAARDIEFDFDWSSNPPALLVDGVPVGERIRKEDVDDRVSVVAGNPQVRERLVRAQRAIAANHPRLVTEGRDQGSVVFPDAQFRFYLHATPEVRADRRVQQSRRSGESVDFDEVLRSIKNRDLRDETRTDGPLKVPDGATMLDTSELTLEAVVDWLVELVLASPSRSDEVSG
jgi:cytidylate kinase